MDIRQNFLQWILDRIVCVGWEYLKTFNCMKRIKCDTLNHLTVFKQMTFGSFKHVIDLQFVYKSCIYIYIYTTKR